MGCRSLLICKGQLGNRNFLDMCCVIQVDVALKREEKVRERRRLLIYQTDRDVLACGVYTSEMNRRAECCDATSPQDQRASSLGSGCVSISAR